MLFHRPQISFKLSSTTEYGHYDFRHCECKMVLYTIHSQILQHAIGSGLNNKIVESYTEFAFICMQSSNINQAINLLLPAERMAKIYASNDESGFYVYLLARIYTLLGRCYFSLQQLSTASKYFIKACETLRLSFPTSKVLIAIQCRYHLVRVQHSLNSNYEDPKQSLIFLAIVYEMIECLSALYKLFTVRSKVTSF
jgi:tetratricopeptide (TPR) repeat protein